MGALTPDTMTKDERSCLLYMESCAVDAGGLAEGVRMNGADLDAAKRFVGLGLLDFGRIPAALLGYHNFSRTEPTHWVRMKAEGWALASLCRQRRALQIGPYATSVYAEVDARAA